MQEKHNEENPYVRARKNAIFLAFILIAATLAVIARLVNIQIIHADEYKKYATASQWNEETISAARGVIYDANGNVLAQSAKAWKIYLIPENFSDEDFRSQVCHDVADALELEYDDLMEATKTEKAEEGELVVAHREVVKSKMELAEKKLVDCGETSAKDCNTNCLKHRTYKKSFYTDGEVTTKSYKYSDVIGLEEDTKRYYPMGTFASSLIGTVNSDGNGVSGIESYYNSTLSGQDGKVKSYGTNVDSDNETTYEAKDGTSLVLTIDETVQYCLDEQLQSVYESSGGSLRHSDGC